MSDDNKNTVELGEDYLSSDTINLKDPIKVLPHAINAKQMIETMRLAMLLKIITDNKEFADAFSLGLIGHKDGVLSDIAIKNTSDFKDQIQKAGIDSDTVYKIAFETVPEAIELLNTRLTAQNIDEDLVNAGINLSDYSLGENHELITKFKLDLAVTKCHDEAFPKEGPTFTEKLKNGSSLIIEGLTSPTGAVLTAVVLGVCTGGIGTIYSSIGIAKLVMNHPAMDSVFSTIKKSTESILSMAGVDTDKIQNSTDRLSNFKDRLKKTLSFKDDTIKKFADKAFKAIGAKTTKTVVDENGKAVLDENGNETTRISKMYIAANVALGLSVAVAVGVVATALGDSSALTTTKDSIADIYDSMHKMAASMEPVVGDAAQAVHDKTGDFITGTLDTLDDVNELISNTTADDVASAAKEVNEAFNEKFDDAIATVAETYDGVKESASNVAADDVVSAVKEAAESVHDKVDDAIASATDTFNDVNKSISEMTVEGVASSIEAAADNVTENYNKFDAEKSLSDIADSISQTKDDVINKVADTLDSFTNPTDAMDTDTSTALAFEDKDLSNASTDTPDETVPSDQAYAPIEMIIQEGDTLEAITIKALTERLGHEPHPNQLLNLMEKICQVNNLDNPNDILAGADLTIPGTDVSTKPEFSNEWHGKYLDGPSTSINVAENITNSVENKTQIDKSDSAFAFTVPEKPDTFQISTTMHQIEFINKAFDSQFGVSEKEMVDLIGRDATNSVKTTMLEINNISFNKDGEIMHMSNGVYDSVSSEDVKKVMDRSFVGTVNDIFNAGINGVNATTSALGSFLSGDNSEAKEKFANKQDLNNTAGKTP